MLKRLDLHGVTHEDARRKVIHFIEDNWNTNNELEIITGCSNTMIDIASEVIEEYKLEYKVGRHHDLVNARLIVFME